MSEPKLLAEWFWTDRYDGSSAALLNMECQGVYRTMLSRAWRSGARLPNDHEAIQRAIRCTPDEWARCWPKVSRYWRVDGDSIVNGTQQEVYAEALAVQQRASERGKKGAQARAQALAQAGTQAKPEMLHEVKPPSPSPSPESVSGRTDDGPCAHPAIVGRKLAPGKLTACPDCGEEFRGPAYDGAGPKPNPFVTGRRDEYELESMRLCREIAALTGDDGAEIMARAAQYAGAAPGRQKVNPAGMSDDRLLNTVLDLRATLKAEQERAGVSA